MDIERLTKQQIVLLTLMVSFMTSIATGIVTVSLMEQAPPAITQTVSKVVEHTVEKVVPSQAAAVAAPIVVSEPAKTVQSAQTGGSVTDAISTADPSVVRLYSSGSEQSVFFGLGVAIDPQMVVTDIGALGEAGDAMVQVPGGKQVHMFVRHRDEGHGLAYLTVGSTTEPVSWPPITIASAHPLLGQTVIVMSGKTSTKIAVGVITGLSPLSDKDMTPVLETNVQDSDIISGSPIIDTDGHIIGISTVAGRASSKSTFLSAAAIQAGKSSEISGTAPK